MSPQRATPNVFEHGEVSGSIDQSRESFTQQVHDDVDMFCTQYAEQADFVSYFQKQWEKKTSQRVCKASLFCLGVQTEASVAMLTAHPESG